MFYQKDKVGGLEKDIQYIRSSTIMKGKPLFLELMFIELRFSRRF
jgi:hypothetical protein